MNYRSDCIYKSIVNVIHSNIWSSQRHWCFWCSTKIDLGKINFESSFMPCFTILRNQIIFAWIHIDTITLFNSLRHKLVKFSEFCFIYIFYILHYTFQIMFFFLCFFCVISPFFIYCDRCARVYNNIAKDIHINYSTELYC